MSLSASVKVGEPDGKDIYLPCGECNRHTCHKALTVAKCSDSHRDSGIEWWNDYMTVQCQGCKTLSFLHEYTCSEEISCDPITGDTALDKTQTMYPSRLAGRQILSRLYALPYAVSTIYQETHTAMVNRMRILAGIGIRAIVEAICKDKSVAGDNLKAKINRLKINGYITQEGVDILHSLRFMGNLAAHEVKAHSDDDLSTAFDLIEILLQGVYILPYKRDELPS